MAKSRSESPLSSIPLLRHVLSEVEGPRGGQGSHERIRQGEETVPGPGRNPIACCHCEERSDEAISKMGSLK
jgi:hypothetical protein